MTKQQSLTFVLCSLALVAPGLSAQAPAGSPETRRATNLILPRQGLTLSTEKILDPATGEVTTITRTRDGAPVDQVAALRHERTLAAMPAYKITPLLRQRHWRKSVRA